MLAAVKILRHRIIRDQKVDPAIVVHVDENRRQTVIAAGIGNAGLHAHIGESAIAVVVKQMIALARQPARAAHDRDATKLAEPRWYAALTGNRRIVGIELHVAGNKEIEEAVVIVVAPGCTRRPSAQR